MIRATPTGVVLDIRVIPRAKTTALSGTRDGALVVRLAAAPVDGAANDTLVEFLAGLLQIRRAGVRIVSGLTGRRKRVEITGVREPEARARLGLHATPPGGV